MTIRVHNEPAWLLHHRPFRDSSRILEIVSRTHGRVALVARGSRSGKSKLAGILRPFMPLSLSWIARTDLGTLTGAEMNGAPLALSGDALLSGYYVNELLLKLTERHDPHADLFDTYGHTIGHLAAAGQVAPVLRQFEMELLRQIGYALSLEQDGQAHTPLLDDGYYEYRAEQGAVPVSRPEGPMVFSGRELRSIGHQVFADGHTLQCAGRLLRGVIDFHLDGRELKSRKVLRDLRTAAGTATKNRPTMKGNHV